MASTDTDDDKRQLSELRECFIELKARLDRNIKENQETMRNIANLNYDIDSLLLKPKNTSAPKTFPEQRFPGGATRTTGQK
jgi:hypothetical protein